MAEDRNILQKIISPTEEEKEKVIKAQDLGQKMMRILREEGYINYELRKISERALRDGVPAEQIKKNMAEAREKLIKDGGTKVKILNFLYPGKGSRFELGDEKREFDYEKKQDTKKEKKKISRDQVGIPTNVHNEATLAESLAGASVSGLIKIPKGVVNFGLLLTDIMREQMGKDVPIDEGLAERFNKAFEGTWLGVIEQQAEEDAVETASGRITQALVQLYGGVKVAQKTTIPAVSYISNKATQLVKAIKGQRYVKTTNNKILDKGKSKIDELNKLSKFDKYVGATVGGGLGAGMMIMKAEDIGTFGDTFDWLPTGMDREKKAMAGADAVRQMINKFKLGSELAVPIFPFFYLPYKGVQRILQTKNQNLALSNSKIDRWIDKFTSVFRARSVKHPAIFEGIQKLEGIKSKYNLIAKDFTRNIDDSLRKMSKNTSKLSEATEPEVLSKLVADFMMGTGDVVKKIKGKNRILFQGFTKESSKRFKDAIKKIGGTAEDATNLIDDATKFRTSAALLKDSILKGKNINVGIKEFNDIMNDRALNYLSSDYKFFDMDKGFWNKFKPLKEAKDDVVKIFERNAKANLRRGEKYVPGTAEILVENILKRGITTLNPITKTPQFPYPAGNVLDDVAVKIKNLADNVTGGKFKPDGKGGLIQTKSDLAAFNRLFGKYKDYKNIIANVTADLASIAGRDRFYNMVKAASDIEQAAYKKAVSNIPKEILAKEGALTNPGIVFKSYNEALAKFPHHKIIDNPNGLKLTTNLAEELYTSPLDGMFTTKQWADALKHGDMIVGSNITKSLPYRMLVLIPKGLANAAKTVFGPFTHTRNFTTAAATTIHSGNIFISPLKLAQFAKQSFQALQPQLLYKMTKNPKYRNLPEADRLYHFLLDNGVVNQSVRGREVSGMWDDILTGQGDIIDRAFNSMSSKLKKLGQIAQELYIAEDDFFRIFNFLAEGHKLTEAYKTAVKNGVKNADGTLVKMPNALELMEDASRIVRETVPNYAYVNDAIKALRKSPLGAFASFKSEIYRTGTNTTMNAIKEMKNPVKETIGHRRLAGQIMAYTAIPIGMVEGAKALYGISNDQLRAIRELFINDTYAEGDVIVPIYEDGKYKIINLSNGYFYDTMINPIMTVISHIDTHPEEPLLKALATGMAIAAGKELEPFIGESIWLQAVLDVFARNGLDKDGYRIYNSEDSIGNIVKDVAAHVGMNLAPLSLPQFKRLVAALRDKTINGVEYELTDEALGFIGLRQIPLDIERKLNSKIGEFTFKVSDDRSLIYKGSLTGDPVKDEDLIVKQFIFANQQKLKNYNQMRKYYDAARMLGVSSKKIEAEFKRRGYKALYDDIKKNKFKPFEITDRMVEAYEYQSKKYGIENPLNKRTKKKIKKIIKRLKKQKLNREFRIDEADYISSLPDIGTVAPQPPKATQLAHTPMPDQKLVASMPKTNLQTGLTRTESALLSPSEQVIARKT